MNTVIMRIYFVCLFIPSILNAQNIWKRYIPEDGSFEVLAPGNMDTGQKHILSDFGKTSVKTYLYKGDNDVPDIIYLINCFNYPEGTLNSDSLALTDSIFYESIAEIKKSLGGDLVYMADQSEYNLLSKIYKINYNTGKSTLKGKMYISGQCFFSVQVFSSFEKSQYEEIDRFIKSFKILRP